MFILVGAGGGSDTYLDLGLVVSSRFHRRNEACVDLEVDTAAQWADGLKRRAGRQQLGEGSKGDEGLGKEPRRKDNGS